jgi:Glycosyl hydrolases family 32 N-terminal domain
MQMANLTCSMQKVRALKSDDELHQHTRGVVLRGMPYPSVPPLRTFLLDFVTAFNAAGPFLLDLGDSLYAPNCFRDGSGRRLMLGWFQELGARGPSSEFTYSGCLTLPRVLSRHGAAFWLAGPLLANVLASACCLLSEVASKLSSAYPSGLGRHDTQALDVFIQVHTHTHTNVRRTGCNCCRRQAASGARARAVWSAASGQCLAAEECPHLQRQGHPGAACVWIRTQRGHHH